MERIRIEMKLPMKVGMEERNETRAFRYETRMNHNHFIMVERIARQLLEGDERKKVRRGG